MIVMKFGGSSLESAEAVQRVTRIVKSQVERQPLVVVSALGETTDILLEAAREAERGHSYLAWKRIKDLWEYHSAIAAATACGASAQWLDDSLHQKFHQLNRLLVKMEDEGGELTPVLQDEILSYGERLSSEVVTAALQSAGCPAIHLDARQFVLTDDRHTQATPLYWECYAKMRRFIPRLAGNRTAVVGGFIGSNERGETTTLGRGGSDLSATLFGAGLNAEEIQIWKDVDGLLTCSPDLFAEPLRLRSVTYREAAAMAKGGAQVLHPETVTPAIRQRIPLVLRNSRRPDVEGSVVSADAGCCLSPFKSIAARQNLTILELRSASGDALASSEIGEVCRRSGMDPDLLANSGDATYIGFRRDKRYEDLKLKVEGCLDVRVREEMCALTLVGASASAAVHARSIAIALHDLEGQVIFDARMPEDLVVLAPQRRLRQCASKLHRLLFANTNAEMFAPVDRAVAAPAAAGSATGRTTEASGHLSISRPRVVFMQN